MELEKMNDFFAKRIDGYETQMLENVEGCKEGYIKLVELIPSSCKKLLDLGCGTGLELYEIFKKIPNLEVTGIDLTQAMLDKLKSNFPDKNINLICGSYFDVPFGDSIFDAAVSVESLHHFTKKEKVPLYFKLRKSLKKNGYFILTDFFSLSDNEEQERYNDFLELKKKLKITDDKIYHYDIPLTVEHESEALFEAGFESVEVLNQWGNTFTIKAVA